MSNSSGWEAFETVNIQNGKLNKEVKELKQVVKRLRSHLKAKNLKIQELTNRINLLELISIEDISWASTRE